MNPDKILDLIRSIIEENEAKRIYPSYVTLYDLTKTASEQFKHYDSERFKDILRMMIKKKSIFAGHTVNEIWISHKKDNYYANSRN